MADTGDEGDAIRLAIKVVPGARRDEIAGWLGDALKLRVCAPPERGKANAAIERLIAESLGLPAAKVRIVAGRSAPRKIVEIEGRSQEEIDARLERPS